MGGESAAGGRVVELLRRFSPLMGAFHDLTRHEVRVLKRFVTGHSYKAAGAEPGVSINKVRSYIRSIYEKLQVHSKSEVVAKAIRERMV